MQEPMNPNNAEATPEVYTGSDEGVNRRFGLGLVISIGANVLLLQGAAVMAKAMSGDVPHFEPTGPTQGITVAVVPKATPTPQPQKSPLPQPRPQPHLVTPVTPVTPPTPPKQHIVTAVTKQTPVKQTTQETRVTPATVASAQAPAAAQPGAAGQPGANRASVQVATRTTSAPAMHAPAVEEAARQPAALAATTAASATAATLSASTANVQTASNAAMQVQANVETRAAGPALTRPGRPSFAPSHLAVLTATRPGANPTFSLVLPTGGERTGARLSAQPASGAATTAAFTATGQATILGATGQQVAVQTSGGQTVVGTTVGSYSRRPIGRIGGELSSMTPHNSGHGPGTIALNASALGSDNPAGHLSVVQGSGTDAAVGLNPANNASLRTGEGGNLVAVEGETGPGRNTVAIVGQGRPNGKVGLRAGGVDGRVGESPIGSIALNRDAVSGTPTGGNKIAHHTERTEQVAAKTPTGPLAAEHQIVAQLPTGGVVTHGTPTAPVDSDPGTHDQDKAIGKTYGSRYVTPTGLAIPESLKGQAFDTSVTIRIVIGSTGQVRASLFKSSGFPDLDAEALAACSRIKVLAVGYEDGSPIDDKHELTFNFRNKG